MSKRVLLLVGDFVESYEAMVPMQALAMLGFEVLAACPGKHAGQTVATAVHDFEGFQTYTEKRGHNFALNCDFDKLNLSSCDGLYVPGGRAPEYLRLNPLVLPVVRHFFDTKKPVAVVCHGVQLLAAAGVCRGRKIACYPACKVELELAGGTWAENSPGYDNVCVDGNLVSGPAWPAHPAVLREFVRKLGVQIP